MVYQQDLYATAAVCAAATCFCNVTHAALQLDHLAVAGTLLLYC